MTNATEPTVRVRYSCRLCTVLDATIVVAARGATQDVADWVQQTLGGAIAADHFQRSPRCTSTRASNVYIPITGAPRIGDPPTH